MNAEEAQRALEEYAKTIHVGLSGWRAQLQECEENWSHYVKAESHGRLRGEIRSYHGDKAPSITLGIRVIWTLCAVDPDGKVVGYDRFFPQEVASDPSESITDFAWEIQDGMLTLTNAKKELKHLILHQASIALCDEIDLGLHPLDRLSPPSRGGEE